MMGWGFKRPLLRTAAAWSRRCSETRIVKLTDSAFTSFVVKLL